MGATDSVLDIVPHVARKAAERLIGRDWVLQAVWDWWRADASRILLLTGGPGAGKSTVMAWLAGAGPVPNRQEYADVLDRLRTAVRAAYFCQFGGRTNALRHVSESVAQQLSASLPGYTEALTAGLTRRVDILGIASAGIAHAGTTVSGVTIARLDLHPEDEEAGFDIALTNPIKRMASAGTVGPMLILIDALDEAKNSQGSSVAEVLSRLDDLPKNVRFVFSSRQDPRMLRLFLGKATRIDIVSDAPTEIDAIKLHAMRQLQKFPRLSEEAKISFSSSLAQQSQGNFLYASLVLNDVLERQKPESANLPLVTFPHGLSSVYHHFLLRELARGNEWFQLYEPLLGLIAAGMGAGLSRDALEAMLLRDLRAPLQVCHQYLSGSYPDGPFKLFHESFANYLLFDRDNHDFRIDPKRMHTRIVDHFYTASPNWELCEPYGLSHLVAHMVEAKDVGRLSTLISPSWMLARVRQSNYLFFHWLAISRPNRHFPRSLSGSR